MLDSFGEDQLASRVSSSYVNPAGRVGWHQTPMTACLELVIINVSSAALRARLPAACFKQTFCPATQWQGKSR